MADRTFHMALSVDVDRHSDKYLMKEWIPYVRINGRIPMLAQFREACAELRAKGYRVFPASECDHVGPTGECLGHEDVPIPGAAPVVACDHVGSD